ncbi:MAG: DUF1302 domain-containing protein [Rhizobiales bacterium]|nr:DUF1302 domain-containing protein [Hyphomicrobiales bacterium]
MPKCTFRARVQRRKHIPSLASLGVLGLAAIASPAQAQSFQVGDFTVTPHGTVTFGTAIRTQSPDPALIGNANGLALGLATTGVGNNSDDSNLNYRRGDPVSTVLKGFGSIDISRGKTGVFVSAKGWMDFTGAYGSVPWGNFANGYVPNTPLNDSGFDSRAQFSGVSLQEAYFYSPVPGTPADVKIGYQVIRWGIPATIGGGLASINAVDVAALRRPGWLPEEIAVPMPALFTRYAVTPNINVEAFWQFANTRNIVDGCGTFQSTSDFYTPGCNGIIVGNKLADPVALANGLVIGRTNDREPQNFQGGIGANYKDPTRGFEIGAYYAHTNWRRGMPDALVNTRSAAVPFLPGNPDGLNPSYFLDYAPNVDTFSLNGNTKLASGAVLLGELTYRPNQPLMLNGVDLLNAFVSATAPTPLRADAAAAPLGSVYPGFDRYQTLQFNLGFLQPVKGILGAAGGSIGGEVSVKHVFDLADPNVRRYERSDLFGLGPVNGSCAVGIAAGLTAPQYCNNDGYVTPTAVALRLRGTLLYTDVITSGFNVSPSVTYGWDIDGWSYDGLINEGRQFVILALRGEYRKTWFAEISYVPTWGGKYNLLRDRSYAALSVGAKF